MLTLATGLADLYNNTESSQWLVIWLSRQVILVQFSFEVRFCQTTNDFQVVPDSTRYQRNTEENVAAAVCCSWTGLRLHSPNKPHGI
uniref:Uncharacterized protein n=1 Tax=Arion vulgaris TaxID=1028688 RepID=A0A0B7A2B5_9EUPU